MTRYRPIKRYGNAWIIKLDPSDIRDLNIKVGDWVDIENSIIKHSIPDILSKVVIKKKKKVNRK